MPVSTTVLFDQPQREIASTLRGLLASCQSVSLVTGFATFEGIEALMAPIRANPTRLTSLVVGAGTYRAYQALDTLLGTGVPPDRLFVHLGHTRSTGAGARHAFYRYHPMLHSKVYLFEMPDGTASAFVGSHNVTGFALLGLNGEAGTLIQGPAHAPEFAPVRNHIQASRSQAVQYTPGMKEAFSWWTSQFLEGLRDKANDAPREGEAKKTIVILAAKADDPLPKKGDVIYFELPVGLGRIQSLSAEVHIHTFPTTPSSPEAGLANLDQARASLWCRTLGLEEEQGGLELRADWYLQNRTNPQLLRTPRPFRPAPSPGMQQVRVKVYNEVFGKFEYLFHTEKLAWEPILDEMEPLQIPEEDARLLQSLQLVPPEDKPWYPVRGLKQAALKGSPAYLKAIEDSSPESGSFILLSMRRRELEK